MSETDTIRLPHFVNRTDATRGILKLVRARPGRSLALVDLVGVEGSGKSLLLAGLEDLLHDAEGVAVARVDVRPYAARADDDAQERQDKLRRLLTALAAGLSRAGFDAAAALQPFADAAVPSSLDVRIHGAELQKGAIKIGWGAKVDVGGDLSGLKQEVHVTPEAVAEQRREQVVDAFIESVTELATTRRAVLLLDAADVLLRQDVGFWLLTDVVAHLTNAVVVVARTSPKPDLPGRPDAERFTLVNLGREHVSAYLHTRLSAAGDLDELVDAIFRFSGGHPEAVSLAADLVDQRGLSGRREVLAMLRDLLPDERSNLHRLVDEIVAAIEDPAVSAALKVAWVARRFDADLLDLLIDEEVDAGMLIDALDDYTFTERCPDDGGPAARRFHEFIRQERDVRLAETDPARYEELHRRCATYFARRMAEDDNADSTETSYLRTLRHDAPAWQSLEREWLYHLAHLRDRRTAGIALATKYLGTFYWYGWYEPSALCTRLLDDWARTQRTAEDSDWLELLRDFAAAYPIVWAHQEPDWDAVEAAMDGLRELGRVVDRDPRDLPAPQQLLRALTDMFLAQSHLRRDPPESEGDVFYLDARALLANLKDDRWLLPWVAFWLGQSALERNDLHAAQRECELALRLGAEEHDEEAVASAWQFRGDLWWRHQRVEDALRAYLIAIGHAFRFLGLPRVPDAYTRSFFDEICEGTIARIRMLWQDGDRDQALRACARIRSEFTPPAQAIGPVPDEPDFAALLARAESPGDRAIRTALLLDIPPGETLRRPLAVRRALRMVKRMVESVEREDAVKRTRDAAEPSATTGPQRLRTDLHPSRAGT